MIFLLTAVHVIACLFLIFVVLLQSAQAADLAGAFGGGGSQTALGVRGTTTLLHKATTGAAVIFMVTSLSLGIFGRGSSSLLEGLDDPAAVTAPAGETVPGGDLPPAAAGDDGADSGTDVSGDGAEQSGAEGDGAEQSTEPEGGEDGSQQ